MTVQIVARVMTDYVSIPAEPTTRDRIKSHLRGGERYDDLLQRMIEQYDPDQVTDSE